MSRRPGSVSKVGFTPDFDSRAWLADGRTVFVKAADSGSSWLHESYALEAANLELLPAVMSGPRGYGVASGSQTATPNGWYCVAKPSRELAE
jgi:hypothetical protein